ncbi:MAG: hypothetical protein EA364_12830 [Balneolaceae bacterium]|nr:MAG: hypothetical protein EA364_12830 [Balneolaceae bacterium]
MNTYLLFYLVGFSFTIIRRLMEDADTSYFSILKHPATIIVQYMEIEMTYTYSNVLIHFYRNRKHHPFLII